MCGRFTLTTDDYVSVSEAFEVDTDPIWVRSYRPRHNIAPSDAHWIVCHTPERRVLTPGTWGFPSPSRNMINARSETMDQRPTFRDAVWSGRCGVAADGFLEWSGPKRSRQPWWFHRPDRRPFLFAGLFRDDVDARSGEVTRRFTILTTRPNAAVAPHHDRMPAILASPAAVDQWLTPTTRSDAALSRLRALLEPVPDAWLESTPVSPRVSDIRNDDPECLHPVELLPPAQQSLF